MTRFWKFALALTFSVVLAINSFAQLIAPQGRLTLVSNTPVMTADVTNATTIYYTPYQGDTVPIYNSGVFSPMAFSQFQLNLSSTYQTSGNIYDLFIGYGSLGGGPNALYLCAGPAWSSQTSRGTAAALDRFYGLWANAATISCYNQSGTASEPANTVDYVGSVYMTGNGETSMVFKPSAAAGGTNNILGLWNAYNRVRVVSENQDSNSSWTYNSTTVRPADGATGNLNNRISFIDGLGQSRVEAEYECFILSQSGETAVINVGLDTTTTPSGTWGVVGYGPSSGSVIAKDHFLAQGFHYVQALEELGDGTAAATYTASGILQGLFVSLEM